jgi:hypothetical protein
MDRVLTLYFKYKDIGGNIGEYEPFATAVIDVEGREEAIKTNEWLTHLMELKIKSDSDVAGVYISDETKTAPTGLKLTTVTKTDNVIQLKGEPK